MNRSDTSLSARWGRVKEVFQATLDRPVEERETFLASACGDDRELADEVRSLLRSHDDAPDFLDISAAEVVGRMEEQDRPGRAVGPWRLIGLLGRGGMGSVHLAERSDGVYRRRAAVKLLNRGMDTDAIVRRFHQERQILADLDHPNIARLIDGGATDDGQSYFVMEHVEGIRIDHFCREGRLSVERRLELFVAVCDAVEYAHRHLIVHRDLKPGNILVTPGGVPKLLDFGIAKMLATDGVPEATDPAWGQALTPEYASPEQLRGEAITVATDVYSLGVLLFSLLTDRRPYPVEGLRPDEIARRTCEEEPPRPSSVAPDARRRARLRGDLDTIVAAALRKEPERRYPSVARLAEDVQRHLEQRPVRERPDTLRYRTGKFVRRHRLSVAAGALLAVTLVAGVAATAWQARVARAERALAERRFEDVRRLAGLYIFEYSDAIEPLPGSTPIRERMIRDAFAYLDLLAREAGDDRPLQMELARGYMKVGSVQARLGDMAGSLESHRRAHGLYRPVAAANPEDVEIRRAMAQNQVYLADRLTDTGQAAAALLEHQEVLELRADILRERPEDPAALRDVWNSEVFVGRALLAMGRFDEGIRRLEEAARIGRRMLRADPGSAAARFDALTSEHTLATGLGTVGDDAGALGYYLTSLGLVRGLVAEDPVSASYRQALSRTVRRVGESLHRLGEPAAALPRLTEAREISEALAKEDPSNQETVNDLVLIHASIGDALRTLRRLDEAAAEYARSRELGEAALDRDPHHDRLRAALAASYRGAGELQVERGDAAGGIGWLTRAVALYDRLVREDPRNAEVLDGQALTREELAAALERQALAVRGVAGRAAALRAACREYERGAQEWSALVRAGLLSPRHADRPAAVQRALDRCRSRPA